MYSRRSRFADVPNAITRALATIAPKHDLTCGNPGQVGLLWPPETLAAALSDPRAVHYAPEPFGLRSARAAIAEKLSREGRVIDPRDVMLTASTSEAYGYLFKLLCDPGDAVLVPQPSYPLFDVLAQVEGVRLIPYRLRFDGEWHVDPELVSLAAQPGVRAVLVVHPNNPTGSFLKRDELSLLEATGLPIVSDEVFSSYGHGAARARPDSLLSLSSRLVFRLSGASKLLALPQLKLAWTVMSGPGVDEARARLEHIADGYLSPSTASQLALPSLLSQGADLHARVMARCDEALAQVRGVIGRDGLVTPLPVEGGWYQILRLPSVLDEEAWVLTLLELDGVLVQPGYFFDMGSGVHVVISLLTEPETLAAGLRAIARRVAQVCG